MSYAEAVELAGACLAKVGVPPDQSRLVAEPVVYAEAAGVPSHGLLRIPYLAAQVTSGKLRPCSPSVHSPWPHIVLIDALGGFGYVAAGVAVDVLARTVPQTGLAFAAVSNSHHFGAAGYFTEKLAAQGFVGLACSNTFGAIAPLHGRSALLGNDPLSLAVPTTSAPVVIDLAPAVVARGRIVKAREEGMAIPDGWALDAAGNPTTNPGDALDGTLRAAGGHKGVVLAMLLDLLIATATASNLPAAASSVYTADGPPPGLGHILLAFDPERLGVSGARDKVTAYLAGLLADGGTAARLPNDRRREALIAARRNGLEIAADLVEKLRRIR